MKLSNLIGAVFLLDQHMSTHELEQRLVDLIDVMRKLGGDEFQMLKTWMVRILSRGMPEEKRNQVARD